MRILYFDCPMGISGDMCLAALIDLGVDLKFIMRELKKLPPGKTDKIDVSVTKETRHSITGTAFRVKLHDAHHHRTYKDIKGIIAGSKLSPGVKGLSAAIFKTIAEAEAKIHGTTADKVHFHEVGAMDSIIDIVGAAIALDSLNISRFMSSPIPLGGGWAKTMHGTIPIPAPATMEILKGVPIALSEAPFELTTPTGAAIIKTVSSGFGPIPAMIVEKTGYGAGKKDFKDAANLLRIIIGDAPDEKKAAPHGERLFILETNIDDMTPQVAGYLMERLLAAGALDVFFTAVQMKKNRPAILLTVLADAARKERLTGIIFSESTSIGVRTFPVERECLSRRVEKVKTPFGAVRVKVSLKDGVIVNAQPEYEDCKTLSEKKGIPLKQVMDAARAAPLCITKACWLTKSSV
ncbi:MAG: nickel pincer cofactor biosynthesis protein LarC [Deltaproteobacteria bacterium]|nr:nickel pincer cofactor biosynthesis protein LarC [Deltaproteobacteria bacterium]